MAPTPPLNPNNLLRYAGLGFQMLATIVVFVFLGRWLDGQLHLSGPWLTLTCTLVGVIGSMYLVIRDVNRPQP